MQHLEFYCAWKFLLLPWNKISRSRGIFPTARALSACSSYQWPLPPQHTANLLAVILELRL